MGDIVERLGKVKRAFAQQGQSQEDLFDRLDELERRVQKLEDDADFRDIDNARPSWNGASHHME